MDLVDVCINFYGKPYQTAVTLLTLWKHSSRHIGKIFMIIEKVQPYGQYEGIPLLKHMLKDLPVEYVYPKYFYYSGSPDESWLTDPEKRYGLKYQYALEKSDKNFLFMSHNDCLYNGDLIGEMLSSVNGNVIAGIGLIGQCWNCPAFYAALCDGTKFENFRPTAAELKTLVDTYKPPRAGIHYKLIEQGYIHPLPECRLNEYACLINVPLYQENVVPNGNILPFGGGWEGTDWGTIWFYRMFNDKHRFINFPFEPFMIHAPFSDNGSGHVADSDFDLYKHTERQAYQYLLAHSLIDKKLPVSLYSRIVYLRSKNFLKKKLIEVKVKTIDRIFPGLR